ncbi:MAG: PAS domain S-box protein [Planctomycetota bacterium]
MSTAQPSKFVHPTRQRLKRWLDLDDEADDDTDVEAHLEICDECSVVLESLQPDNNAIVNRLKRLNLSDSMMETIASPESDDDSDPGDSILTPLPTHQSRWTLLRLLTVGGIGEIWLARDELLGRTVAVKRLRKETGNLKSVQRRFIYEARITAQLNHPGIVYIFDLVENGHKSYYAMSLIHGDTMYAKIIEFHQRKMTSRFNYRIELFVLLRAWVAVARTIAFAHAQQVLHRDIKSENIIVGQYGEVTVIDWGIAKRVGESELVQDGFPELSSWQSGLPKVRQTRHGVRLGTPAFMSPEQARGDVESIDERSDVYGLTAMLYEILTGQTPFVADDVDSMLEQVIKSELVSPKTYSEAVPSHLDEVCVKGMARDPDERYQSANDIADAVEEWMNSETLKEQTDIARQKLFELSADLMVMFDATPKILWVNAAWERRLGWSLDDLVGLRPNILVHPEDLGDERNIFREIQGGSTVSGLERRMQASDGSFHWFSWTVTPLVDEGITVAIGRNIDALVRKRDEFANLLEAAPEAIVVVNLDHTIHRVNRHATNLFGYTEAELIGQPIDVLVPQRYHRPLQTFLDNYRANVDVEPLMQRDNLLGRHKDGNRFGLGIRLSPVESEDGTRIVSTIRRM